ncbi:regulator of hypoxia-inducible factor 1-like isoform X2 [Anopheles stephensi]|uniref:regulator of hypoxia-inducible factor 1-like isoform X2 n=1 Tax=Anopheles stephensi TaxID=30069 RepID=UPI0016589685|nr:regulator of hypoxia-inducible factor 1-like isoform X2 [Anopheles stephensi]
MGVRGSSLACDGAGTIDPVQMMNLVVQSGLLVLTVALCGALGDRQDPFESYAKLPRIYEYDDFHTCRQRHTDFVFCVSVSTLQADPSNVLWQNISRLRSNRRNFPHDQLERGLCLNDLYAGVTTHDHRTAKLIDAYLHHRIYDQYGLNSHTTTESCWTRTDFEPRTTFGEYMFGCLTIILLLATLGATWIDFNARPNDLFVDAFSIRRNVQRLWAAPKPNALPFLDGFRALGMLTILIVHSQLPLIRMPVWNTEALEAQANHFIFPLVNSGNTHMIQFFFTLGGMVFGISCLRHFDRSPSFRFMYFIDKLLRRLVRLLPAYGFIIIYQATWYRRIRRGPLEYKFNDFCLNNWWSNILFVNNYIHTTKPCLQFSWYLGADFQLFLIGSALLLLVWKFPSTKGWLVRVMVAVALVLPGYIIYTTLTTATMTFDMRHALAELRTYDHFLKYYLPSHTNISGYFFGIIAAMVYRSALAKGSPDQSLPIVQKWLKVSLVALVGLNAFTTLLPFVSEDQQHSLFLAIYGSLLKASWGCSYSLVFLVFALKGKSRLLDMLSHSGLQFFAKISYCMYIVQYSVIYGLYTNFPIPMVYGGFNLLLLTSASLLLTVTSALLLYLAVEAPVVLIGNAYVTTLLKDYSTASEAIEAKQARKLL